jgi:hypothetical protein
MSNKYEIDVSCLIKDVDPFELSASRAEKGKNAGSETWANAKQAAIDYGPELDVPTVKNWFANFGAWDEDEIASWNKQKVDALVLQYAAGNLRELQALCTGKGLAGVNWKKKKKS